MHLSHALLEPVRGMIYTIWRPGAQICAQSSLWHFIILPVIGFMGSNINGGMACKSTLYVGSLAKQVIRHTRWLMDYGIALLFTVIQVNIGESNFKGQSNLWWRHPFHACRCQCTLHVWRIATEVLFSKVRVFLETVCFGIWVLPFKLNKVRLFYGHSKGEAGLSRLFSNVSFLAMCWMIGKYYYMFRSNRNISNIRQYLRELPLTCHLMP